MLQPTGAKMNMSPLMFHRKSIKMRFQSSKTPKHFNLKWIQEVLLVSVNH